MLDNDLIMVNNILIASSQPLLTLVEAETTTTFTDQKSYFDFVYSILFARKTTTTGLNLFYDYADSQGIVYPRALKPLDIFIIGGASWN